jgi:hypothetical protein
MLVTKSDSYVQAFRGKDRSYSGPLWTPSVTFSRDKSFNASRTRTTETQVPGWRRRIQRGENATTFLQGSIDQVKYVPGYAFRYLYDKSVDIAPDFGQSRWESTGPLFSSSGSVPSSVGNPLKIEANNEALRKFVTKVNELQSAFKGGVFVGELRESLDLLLHPAKNLRKRVDQYVKDARRNFRRSRGTPKVKKRILRDTWLEWSFGVQPLISDVKSGFEGLMLLNEEINEYASGLGRRIITTVSEESDQGVNSNVLSWTYQGRGISDYSIRYFGKVDVATNPGGWRYASDVFGFRWQEFVPTVWELIPYSFLVDYFTNIGDIITAYSTCRSALKWVARTEREELSLEFAGFKLNKLLLAQYQIRDEFFRPPQYKRSTKTVLRSTYIGALIPQFEIQLPGYGLKWLNIAALGKSRSIH